jgi:hypothetical protein
MPSAKTPWKPPLGLLALDVLGFGLLSIGLVMQFAPETSLAQTLPGTLRLPLLIIGGGMAAVGWVGMLNSLLAYRRR